MCFYVFRLPQEAAWTVTDECIQVMGGMGFMKVSPASTSCCHKCTEGLCGTKAHDLFVWRVLQFETFHSDKCQISK